VIVLGRVKRDELIFYLAATWTKMLDITLYELLILLGSNHLLRLFFATNRSPVLQNVSTSMLSIEVTSMPSIQGHSAKHAGLKGAQSPLSWRKPEYKSFLR